VKSLVTDIYSNCCRLQTDK